MPSQKSRRVRERRAVRNRPVRTNARSRVTAARTAIAEAPGEAASAEVVRNAASALARAAQKGVILKGDEIDYSKLHVGVFVEVTYYSEKDKKVTSKGYIKAVEDDVLIIGKGLWKERIEIRNIITLKIRDFDPLAFVPGARIRITAPSAADYQLVGTLTKLDGDSLMMKSQDDRQLVVPLASVRRFEITPWLHKRADY